MGNEAQGVCVWLPRIRSSGWVAGPEGLRSGVLGRGKESGQRPTARWGPDGCFPPLPVPTFPLLAGSPYKLHHELGEGKGLSGHMRSAEAPILSIV